MPQSSPPSSSEDTLFRAARAQTEPQARVSALNTYLSTYPSGAHHAVAQQLLLETLLHSFPDQTDTIHHVAADEVQSVPPGIERWLEEARVANLLAEAGPSGVDLSDAAAYASDALHALTEASYKRETTAAQVRYRLPKVPPKQMHEEFLQYRVSFLAAMANVDLRQHHLDAAAPLLSEAYGLQPLSGDVNALRGELALATGDDAAALESFERADAMGSLHQPWRDAELRLFQDHDHGDAAALETRLDAVYRSLYPPVFALPKRQLAAGGHTVLLELFTGSGCLPCAGPDLAMESLLGSYRRTDLAVLEYDEHIPRPDPLANPDSVARAEAYGVGNTPAAFLDGQPAEILGAARRDVENVVVDLAEQIEEQASRPSGLRLTMTVTEDRNSVIAARPAISIVSLAPAQAASSTGQISFRQLSHAVLYVALVQDNVRYSGENGVRLHRMVVRSLQHGEVMPYLTTSTTAAPPFAFRPADLDRAQKAYLESFQVDNDRFGAFHFKATDIPLRNGPFAVVAWVQDPASHAILQSAFAELPSP